MHIDTEGMKIIPIDAGGVHRISVLVPIDGTEWSSMLAFHEVDGNGEPISTEAFFQISLPYIDKFIRVLRKAKEIAQEKHERYALVKEVCPCCGSEYLETKKVKK